MCAPASMMLLRMMLFLTVAPAPMLTKGPMTALIDDGRFMQKHRRQRGKIFGIAAVDGIFGAVAQPQQPLVRLA